MALSPAKESHNAFAPVNDGARSSEMPSARKSASAPASRPANCWMAARQLLPASDKASGAKIAQPGCPAPSKTQNKTKGRSANLTMRKVFMPVSDSVMVPYSTIYNAIVKNGHGDGKPGTAKVRDTQGGSGRFRRTRLSWRAHHRRGAA